ncbi:hypothetical protein AY599_02920 [Leptolyngbya valderiana BDU 20041]|nr:hypothetical protein AY599_02920 [Leptolyngbya valderiana BDU 20041]
MRIIASSVVAGLLVAAAPAHAQVLEEVTCGAWEPVGGGIEGSFFTRRGRIQDLVTFDDGSGEKLYVAGNFLDIIQPDGTPLRSPALARWDGERFTPVPGLEGPAGSELDGWVTDVLVTEEEGRDVLYVAGGFTHAAGIEVNGVARFDGDTWSALAGPEGVGVAGPREWPSVGALAIHDDGSGPALYVGGSFTAAGGRPAGSLARWDGADWSGVEFPFPDESVYSLASYGGDLYASGRFGDSITGGIARWEDGVWSQPLGSGERLVYWEVWPLLVGDELGRDVLVAGGRFAVGEAGEPGVNNLAAWDGQRWSGRGTDAAVAFSQIINLLAYDDGYGPALFIAGVGRLAGVGAVAIRRDGRIARLQDAPPHAGFALATYDDGSGEALYLGGDFRQFGAGPSYLARWRPAPRCPLDFTGDCLADLRDFTAYLNAFDAGDPRADFDGDGSLTIFDFFAFQNAFEAGCP